ncbi:hypothetical protein [Burkholderia cenocepacia]|nr:hypothetical protein [Burkholderia cenocepacia]MBR8249773.1 hypothetical protein [Burkholderia cenocepacia]MBR8285139.1 hypothetical protein [Burkholderia cenocepacia]MBR8501530.1 hypothetical protein [Burkholderia cenocepacia]USB85597.1 hypothetical protein NBG98_04675 [Burkholderia cenocepacia]
MNKKIASPTRPTSPGGTLAFQAEALEKVGWFIPPYAQMGWINSLAGDIHGSADSFSQDDLEVRLAQLYSAPHLAEMVLHRYPIAPVIQNYAQTIEEAVEAHFLGLDHVAVGGLVPVIEGAGRALAKTRGLAHEYVRDVFVGLAADCKEESASRSIGASGEVASMMDSFAIFADRYFYTRSDKYPLHDRTNRHGISHGEYTDADYGRPLNFYKTIAAVDFLTFVSSFRANISWFAPNASLRGERVAMYYDVLGEMRRRFRAEELGDRPNRLDT